MSEDKLNIGCLVYGPLNRLGGYQVFTVNLLQHLTERGHRTMLCLPRSAYREDPAFHDGIASSIRLLPPASSRLLRRAPWVLGAFLRGLSRRERLHVWQIIGAYPAGYAAHGLKGRIPTVLRAYGDDIQLHREIGYGLREDPRMEALIRKACGTMDRVVAMTPSMADCYLELGVDRNRIVEIPNGVDVERLSEPRKADASSTESGGVHLLTVGRYHPKKGFDLIPDIAALLAEHGVDFRWTVVGTGTEVLGSAVERHGLTDRFSLPGEIASSGPSGNGTHALPDQRLVDIYRSSDLFVFPSYIEGFPRVVIEAMAAGLPVVTSDAPGCRDVVDAGRTGLLAPPGDTRAFADRVRSLAADAGLRSGMSQEARAHAVSFDWSRVASSYESVYASLVG